MRISDWSSDVCSSDLREMQRDGQGDGTDGGQGTTTQGERGNHLLMLNGRFLTNLLNLEFSGTGLDRCAAGVQRADHVLDVRLADREVSDVVRRRHGRHTRRHAGSGRDREPQARPPDADTLCTRHADRATYVDDEDDQSAGEALQASRLHKPLTD